MNAKELPQYKEVITSLTHLLYDLPGKLIAIDVQSGVGKTTLPNQGKLVYLDEALARVITSRLKKPRPVFVDGVAVRRLVSNLALKPDFVIYISSSDTSESRTLKDEIASYEADFNPRTSADIAIDITHPL